MKRIILLCVLLLFYSFVKASELSYNPLPNMSNSSLEFFLKEKLKIQSERDKCLIINFLNENKKCFHAYDLQLLGETLSGLSRAELLALDNIDIKDPVVSVALSVFAGALGADRFYLGDIGLGIAKLVTCGGLGLWWLIDIFVISSRTKYKNAKEVTYNLALYNAIYTN